MASDPTAHSDFVPVKPRRVRPAVSGDARNAPPASGAGGDRRPAFTADAVLFYGPRDPNPYLSNFSDHSVMYLGSRWPTCEHAFQGAKFMKTDPGWADKIRRAKTPGEAKKYGVSREHPIVDGWDELRVRVMEEILRAKLEQHPALRKALLETGDRLIAENSPHDRFWGIGSDRSGLNTLGRIWMKIRADPPKTVSEAAVVASDEMSPSERAAFERAARFRSMYACGASSS